MSGVHLRHVLQLFQRRQGQLQRLLTTFLGLDRADQFLAAGQGRSQLVAERDRQLQRGGCLAVAVGPFAAANNRFGGRLGRRRHCR